MEHVNTGLTPEQRRLVEQAGDPRRIEDPRRTRITY